MKIKNLSVIVLFLLGVMMLSCSSEDEYSCNPEVNSWVKDNLSDIKKMTRSEWVTLDENIKGPVFGAFEPQQKKEFWEQKMLEVLALDWNAKELKHLKDLQSFLRVNSIFFDVKAPKSDKEIKNFDLYLYKWMDVAENSLGWDKKLITSIIGSGNKLLDKNGTLSFNKNTNTLRSENEGSCNCNVTYDFCTGSYPECYDVDCDSQPYCGWFLLSSCNGKCG